MKQDLPNGHSQNEPSSQDEPKITSHRKDVAAYFLGGGAAITLTIASSLFSSNPSAAIFWFWVTGGLGVTSGCLFWAAREKHIVIILFWFFGVVVVSMGCLVWALINRALEASKTTTVEPTFSATIPSVATPTPTPPLSAPPATPTLSPTAVSQCTLTPTQIAAKIRSQTGIELEDTQKALEGLSIDWILRFDSARREAVRPGPYLGPPGPYFYMIFSGGPKYASPLVAFRIPLSGNKLVLLIEKGEKFRVRGVIDKQPTAAAILLKDGAIFEPVP